MTAAQRLADAAVTLMLADAFAGEPAARLHFLKLAALDIEAVRREQDAPAVVAFLFDAA